MAPFQCLLNLKTFAPGIYIGPGIYFIILLHYLVYMFKLQRGYEPGFNPDNYGTQYCLLAIYHNFSFNISIVRYIEMSDGDTSIIVLIV